jgi:aspartate kinase
MKVMKFGGTSVGKPERMQQVAQLITKSNEPTIVVLSALSGTTNSLVEISNCLAQGNKEGAKQNIDKLEIQYKNFVIDLLKKKSFKQKRMLLLKNILSS